MVAQTIGTMTKEELQAMIEQAIECKFKELLANTTDSRMFDAEQDARTVDEILASLKRNRWAPPPGSPSTTELIREDRNR